MNLRHRHALSLTRLTDSRQERRPDSRKWRKSSLRTASGNDKKQKTESETANCCKISQYIDGNVAALDGWQSEDVGCKVVREYKTSGTLCVIQATAGDTPMVSADRCVNFSQRTGIVT